ncbi:MAG: hypothetical protein COS30_02475 [Candidatus Portnoybacteria bacterium CG02_land_8_20_14_3_00_45_8]|uniref:Uncharacterized protein n=1 Tax=Candidatus Portnoybacteria bacterium CG02_land_8_20_14_3_00_45_8 TaxID=1974807 RepID=A0A2M7D5U4_9BACT|nr:MAG: hypothetical protein COS30_02475 [Candidatus Portnoybacteria bacterium CG02_land_8_20_14_3_00_45_8]
MQVLSRQENLYWTDHVKTKMRQYRLSESRVKRVLRHPKRREVGVAPDTTAGMQPAGSPKHPYEIWVMWQQKLKIQKSKLKTQFSAGGQRITIISAWRYPGISPVHEPPPIPEEVWELIRKNKIRT